MFNSVNFQIEIFYYQSIKYQMERKVGIRLRHIEGTSEIRNNPSTYMELGEGRKQKQSPSPINRRKIFTNHEQNGFSRNRHGGSQ
jgi:hypothetical protein